MAEDLVPSETAVSLESCIDIQKLIILKRGNYDFDRGRMKSLCEFFFRYPERPLQVLSVGNVMRHSPNDRNGQAIGSKCIVVLSDSLFSGLGEDDHFTFHETISLDG